MDVDVNWLAVVLAALSSLVVGSVWYTPAVFGKQWMELVKLDKKKAEKDGLRAIVIAAVLALVTAYVLAHVTFLSNYFFQNSYLQDSLTTAFWVWLGFTAARLVTHDTFEGRRQKLSLLNMGHELVTLLVMGLIIGLLQP